MKCELIVARVVNNVRFMPLVVSGVDGGGKKRRGSGQQTVKGRQNEYCK